MTATQEFIKAAQEAINKKKFHNLNTIIEAVPPQERENFTNLMRIDQKPRDLEYDQRHIIGYVLMDANWPKFENSLSPNEVKFMNGLRDLRRDLIGGNDTPDATPRANDLIAGFCKNPQKLKNVLNFYTVGKDKNHFSKLPKILQTSILSDWLMGNDPNIMYPNLVNALGVQRAEKPSETIVTRLVKSGKFDLINDVIALTPQGAEKDAMRAEMEYAIIEGKNPRPVKLKLATILATNFLQKDVDMATIIKPLFKRSQGSFGWMQDYYPASEKIYVHDLAVMVEDRQLEQDLIDGFNSGKARHERIIREDSKELRIKELLRQQVYAEAGLPKTGNRLSDEERWLFESKALNDLLHHEVKSSFLACRHDLDSFRKAGAEGKLSDNETTFMEFISPRVNINEEEIKDLRGKAWELFSTNSKKYYSPDEDIDSLERKKANTYRQIYEIDAGMNSFREKEIIIQYDTLAIRLMIPMGGGINSEGEALQLVMDDGNYPNTSTTLLHQCIKFCANEKQSEDIGGLTERLGLLIKNKVVNLLSDAPDQDGVTQEDLLRQEGWDKLADLLLANMDRWKSERSIERSAFLIEEKISNPQLVNKDDDEEKLKLALELSLKEEEEHHYSDAGDDEEEEQFHYSDAGDDEFSDNEEYVEDEDLPSSEIAATAVEKMSENQERQKR